MSIILLNCADPYPDEDVDLPTLFKKPVNSINIQQSPSRQYFISALLVKTDILRKHLLYAQISFLELLSRSARAKKCNKNKFPININ